MRAAWTCAAVAAICLLLSSFHPTAGWALPAIMIGMAVLAALRPYEGLLVFAGLGPLWTIVRLLAGTEIYGPGVDQALALAFIAGWICRRALLPRPLAVPPGVRWSTTVLIAASVASAVVSTAILVAEHPGAPAAHQLWTLIARDYFLGLNALTPALLFMEGLVLLLIVADACATDETKRYRVLRMMTAGAAAAAAFNLLRILMLPIQHGESWRTLAGYFVTTRVNVHYADVNAAGSYFAMMLFAAAAVVARQRLVGVAATVLIGAGLWLAGSRVALAAAFITGACGAVVALLRHSSRRALSALAVLALVTLAAAALWRWYPESRNVNADYAIAFRVEMAKAALHVAADHPWFGAGLGRLHPLSEQYASMPENAHNNFLQVLAELGLTGLLLFLSVIGFALREAWRGGRWGLVAGLCAFLVSCLGGHPLLVAGAAFPFFMALGLAASAEGPVARPALRPRVAAAGLLLLFAIALPFRTAEAVRQANLEHASVGFSVWQREPDGSRYRWAGGRSRFFVESSARAVGIRLRPGPDAPAAVEVRIRLNGREVNRVLLAAGDQWRVVRVLLARKERAAFLPIDLEAWEPGASAPLGLTDTSRVLMVGRPIIER